MSLFSRCLQLPVVLEFLEAVEHAEERKIHRAHVERGDFRLVDRGGTHALVDRHGRRAAGGEVDHAVGALLDDLQERREGFRALVGLAGLRIARVQMHDRRAGFGGVDRGIGDFLRRHRQRLRHRRRVDRAGHGAGDDDFAAHGCSLSAGRYFRIYLFCAALCAASAARRSLRRCVSVGDAFRRRLMRPCRDHPIHIGALVNLGPGGRRGQLLVEAGVARAIIRDAAGRVEFDGLERPEERPAQAEAVLDGVVEIFGRDVALADQAERFGQQRALQPVEDKAVDLAVDGDRHLADLAIDFPRALDRSPAPSTARRTARPAAPDAAD